LLGLLINSLNAKLNPICHLLALLGAHHILHVRGVRVNKKIGRDMKGSGRGLIRSLIKHLTGGTDGSSENL
jgi:hypothetical protein